jgi:hypothetical protein
MHEIGARPVLAECRRNATHVTRRRFDAYVSTHETRLGNIMSMVAVHRVREDIGKTLEC